MAEETSTGSQRSCRRRGGAILALLFSLTALTSAPLLAATIQGHVLDLATGRPIEGATVMPAGGELSVLTGPDGAFGLSGMPDEPFTVVASHLAYETALMLVDPARLPPAGLEFVLEPTYYEGERIVVEASRYGPSLHLSQSNLTQEQIKPRRSEKDVPFLLAETPGLYASSDAGNFVGYTYLNLRGFDQRRVGVMVNGIPLNDPEDHQVYWVDLPDLASSLEDVQVQRGVTNSLGGMSAIGGSVNLVTNLLRDEPGGHFDLALGSYGSNKQSLFYQTGLLAGRFAMGLRVSHLASDGYRDRSGSDQWGFFWSARFLSEATSTQINIYSGREISQQAWDGISDEMLLSQRTYNPETYTNAIDDFRQPHVELHHRINFSNRIVFKNSLYWIHGEGFYENFKENRTAEDFSLDLADSLHLDPDDIVDLVRRKNVDKDQFGLVSKLFLDHRRGRLVLGGDVYDFNSHHWGDLQSVQGAGPEELLDLPPYYEYNGDKFVWSVYLNERMELFGGLSALLDLHYQRKTYTFLQRKTGNFRGENRNGYEVEYDFFNPKGGLYYRLPAPMLGGELGIYGHLGIAHREPTDSELFDTWYGPDDLGAQPLFGSSQPVIGGDGEVAFVLWRDPLVQAERVLNYELGFSWRNRWLSLSCNGYVMDFRDEIVSFGAVNEDGAAIRGNADQTLHRGLEAGLTLAPSPAFALRLAASRSWDRYEKFIFYEDVYDEDTWEYLGAEPRNYAGNPIAYFPQYLAKASLDADLGPIDALLSYQAVGMQYLDNTGNGERSIDPYSVIDLSLALMPIRLGLESLGSTRFYLQVRNLLDAEYETRGYYDAWGPGNAKIPAAKRHYLAGVQYEF